MPSIALTRSYTAEYPTLRRTYDWFLPEEVQRTERTQWEYYDFVASAIERQLEMFSRQAAVDDSCVFKHLVERWRLERGATSSTTEMVLCPAYQSIIGMGPKAIPFIVAELASEGDDPDHWFWALQALTGANPVSEDDEGNLRRMSRAWLDWATAEGYAW